MRVFFALVFVFSFISCTTAPKQAEFPVTYQSKIQSAQHWEGMAKKIASEVKDNLKDWPSPVLLNGSENFGHSLPYEDDSVKDSISFVEAMKYASKGKGPVYISDFDKSVFGKTMRTFLINELSKRDIEVSADEKNAYKLDWACQKIHHNDPRYDKPGFIEVIFISAPKAFLFGGEIYGGRPHNEILLTFKLQNHSSEIFRKSKLLYIADVDQDQYQTIPETMNHKSRTSISKEVTIEVQAN